MSTVSKRNPIGRAWTAVLRFIRDQPSAWMCTADIIGAALWPTSAMSDRMRAVIANAMLHRIAKTGCIASSDPRGEMLGVIWSLTPIGSDVLSRSERSHVRSPNSYKSSASRRQAAKRRRDALAALNLCINGPKHGPRTHGKKCAACHETHRRTA